jgi:hypothetical protein
VAKGLVSEFNGEDGRSGLPKYKPVKMLTAAQKLRLGYTVGVEDPDMPPNRAAWVGDPLESEETS